MPGRARGAQGVLEVFFNVATRQSKRLRQRGNRARFVREQIQEVPPESHAIIIALRSRTGIFGDWSDFVSSRR